MSYKALPEYIAVEANLQDNNIPMTPAELHGLITGLIVGQLPQKQGIKTLYDYAHDGKPWNDNAESMIQELYEITHTELVGEGLELNLTLLQPEESPLIDRAEALTDWVSMFISGIGLSGIALDKAPSSIKEIMKDLYEITKLGIDEDEMEEQAALFEQVLEHTKVCAMTCFIEFSKVYGK